jgi:hypothetical protein
MPTVFMEKNAKKKITDTIDSYARMGFRTMVMARRVLTL